MEIQIANVVALVDAQEDRQPIILARDIELLLGINDTPLLYVGEHRNYIRLNALGADIVRILQEHPDSLTYEDLAQIVNARYPGREAQIAQKLTAFLQQLHDAKALTLPNADQKPWVKRAVGKATSRPMLRLGLWRPDRPVAYTLVRRFSALANDTSSTLLGIWLMAAVLMVGFVVVQSGTNIHISNVVWPLVVVAFLLHLTIHEFCHTLVGSYYNVKIREIGVALLYYVLPVAYTDRTDSYRLRNPAQRMRISLAGPAFDISAAAISALFTLLTGGWVGATFHVLLALQTMTCISNLNPLMPSDGYHALEAFLGGVNFRRRAFVLFLHRITLRRLPAHLRDLSRDQQIIYFVYGVIMVVYVSIVILFILWTVVNSVLGVMKV